MHFISSFLGLPVGNKLFVTVVVVLVVFVVFVVLRAVEARETSIPGATLAAEGLLLRVVVVLLELVETVLCPVLEEVGTCLLL